MEGSCGRSLNSWGLSAHVGFQRWKGYGERDIYTPGFLTYVGNVDFDPLIDV